MSSNFDDVHAMHTKFDMPRGGPPRLLPTQPAEGDKVSLYEFRYDFMIEELIEFAHAHHAGDLAGAADALIDLVVVAMGTAVMMGLPWQLLWDDVHRANMSKVRGMTTRGTGVDLVKPEGWEPPKTHELLQAFARALERVPESWRSHNPPTEIFRRLLHAREEPPKYGFSVQRCPGCDVDDATFAHVEPNALECVDCHTRIDL